MTMSGGSTTPRRTRSDGERRRRAILLAAANLSATRGLDRLSIAELAEHAGMSKSGLFAHFGSKEELQLATIEMAEEIYDREVVDRREPCARGRDAMALAEGHIDHLDRRVFAGACFFASAGAEFAPSPGRSATRLEAFQDGWMALLREPRRGRARGRTASPTRTSSTSSTRSRRTWCSPTDGSSFNGDPSVLDLARAVRSGSDGRS